jgi:hypothetical protein
MSVGKPLTLRPVEGLGDLGASAVSRTEAGSLYFNGGFYSCEQRSLSRHHGLAFHQTADFSLA